MSDADLDRLERARRAFRINHRRDRRLRGLDPLPYAQDRLDLPPASVAEGLEATPAELLSYMSWRADADARSRAALERAAGVGMAVEIGMHELAQESGIVSYALREAAQSEGLTDRQAAAIADGRDALARLTGSMHLHAQMRRDGSCRAIRGKEIHAAIARLYGHAMDRSGISLEATPAFLEAEIGGQRDILLPAFMNLVRNAWYWAAKDSRTGTVRLDAERVLTRAADPNVDPDDPEDGYLAEPAYEWVLSVEDSGPGIPRGAERDVFEPFWTGRRGGTGIGLHLTRRNLAPGRTAVVDPAGSDLGGARFLVGPVKLLDPVPPHDLAPTVDLALAAVGIARLFLDGRGGEIPRRYGEEYAAIAREALRIRLEGPRDASDAVLLRAADAMSGILEGRLDATALEPFEDRSAPGPRP